MHRKFLPFLAIVVITSASCATPNVTVDSFVAAKGSLMVNGANPARIAFPSGTKITIAFGH